MTVTVPVLRSWQPGDLRAAAADLAATSDTLAQLREAVGAAMAQMQWHGSGADAARGTGEELRAVLVALRESFCLQAEVVARAAPVLERAQDLLAEAVRVAAAYGLTVLPDGSVTDPPPVVHAADLSPSALAQIAAQQAAARAAQARAQALAREALRSAGECDRDAAAALQAGDGFGRLVARLAPQVSGLLGLALPLAGLASALRQGLLDAVAERPVPRRGTDPHQVSAWWRSLPPDAQRALLTADPASLGMLDGLPASVRDKANRAALAGERAALLAEAARLQKRLDDNLFGGHFTDDDAALEHVRGKLAALDAIERTIAERNRRLLVLDLSGEQAKAAVAIGDVDTADHVGVFTPGMTTTVQGSLGRYDRQLAALRLQADNLAAREGTGTVATIAWLGYEAPQWGDTWRPSRSVANDEAAHRGAERLSAFLNGLDASRSQPPHLTALGHSYGSLTTGLALQRGTGVDDVVFFGSPGIGTSDIRELGVAPGRAYVVEARRDAVADLAAFGIDPNQLPGITGLAATERRLDGVLRQESTGHSGYLTKDTTSQYGMAAVVAGVPHLAPRDTDEGRGLGDLLVTPLPEPLR